ncbi:MAG: InlB B-repeat-containing protein [Kiritimatiellia bacterium]|nr:InlB B-repeat-containing protein [Kiritimatiellia bacterium]
MIRKLLFIALLLSGGLPALAAELAVVTNIPTAYSANNRIHIVVSNVAPDTIVFRSWNLNGTGSTNVVSLVKDSTLDPYTLYISEPVAPIADISTRAWQVDATIDGVPTVLLPPVHRALTNPTASIRSYKTTGPTAWSSEEILASVNQNPNYRAIGDINPSHHFSGWCSTNAGMTSALIPGPGCISLYNTNHTFLVSGLYSNGLKSVSFSLRRPTNQALGDFYVFAVTNDLAMADFSLIDPESHALVAAWNKIAVNTLSYGSSTWSEHTFANADGSLLVPDGVPYRLYFLRTHYVSGTYNGGRLDIGSIALVPDSTRASLSGSFTPAVPDKFSPITFHAALAVETPNWPVLSSSVKVHYRLQGASEWTTVDLTSHDAVSASATLPNPLEAGLYDYYFSAEARGFLAEQMAVGDLPKLVSPVATIQIASFTVKTLYIAGNGDDSNEGLSWAAPLRQIQKAIDTYAAANTELIVYVTNGVYSAIDTKGFPVRIQSVSHPTNVVIDAAGSGRAATLLSEAENAVGGVLVGMTLKNGLLGAGLDGAGVYGGSLINCILSANTTSARGGAAANATLHNCLLTGNRANEGGAAYGCTVFGATVANNTTESLTSTALADTQGGNNILWNNLVGASADASDEPANPLFVNPSAGDYHLWKTSPYENAGDNALVATQTDLDGAARIQGGRVSKGAFETTIEATLAVQPLEQTVASGASSCTFGVDCPAPWSLEDSPCGWLTFANVTGASFDCLVAPAPADLTENRSCQITVSSYGVSQTVTVNQQAASGTVSGGGVDDAVTGGHVIWKPSGEGLKAEGLGGQGQSAWLRKEYGRGLIQFNYQIAGNGVLSVSYGADVQFAVTNAASGTIELYIPFTTNVVWEFTQITPTVSGSATIDTVKWTAVMDVSFEVDGGTISPTFVSVTNGAPYGDFPVPDYETAVFSHWLLGEQIIRPDTIVVEGTNHAVKAVSLPITLSVDPTEQTVPPEGGSYLISVAATNATWSFSGTPSWIAFASYEIPTETNTLTELRYSVQPAPYSMEENREATLTFKAKGVTQTHHLVQSPAQTSLSGAGLSGAVTGGSVAWTPDGETVVAKQLPVDGSAWIRSQYGRGVVTFDYLLSNGGTLTILVDGSTVYTFASSGGWQSAEIDLPAPATVVWLFERHAADSENSQAQLRNVLFSPRMTVTFDPNGGSVYPPTRIVTYGRPYGALPKPVRASHIFNGWYNGSERVTASTIVNQSENHMLTARWEYYPEFNGDSQYQSQNSCIVTNIPTEYSTGDQICVLADMSVTTLAFCYMQMNGVPFEGKEINEIPLTKSEDGTYRSANVRGKLPPDGSYWYWIKDSEGNSLTPRLNLARYQPLSTFNFTEPSDWTWTEFASTAGGGSIASVRGIINPYNHYTGWCATNAGLFTVALPGTGGLNLYNVANAVLCSPIYSNGLQRFSMLLERPNTALSYNSPHMAVYVLTNDFNAVRQFSLDRPLAESIAREVLIDDGATAPWIVEGTTRKQQIEVAGTDRDPIVEDGIPFMICIRREPFTNSNVNPNTARAILRNIVVTPLSSVLSITNAPLASFIPAHPAQSKPFQSRALVHNHRENWPAVSIYPKLNYRVAGTESYSSIDMNVVEEDMYGAFVAATNGVWNNTVFASALRNASLPAGLYDFYFSCDYCGFDASMTNLVDNLPGVSSPVGQVFINFAPSSYSAADVWLASGDMVVPTFNKYWIGEDTVAFVLESKSAATNGVLRFRFAASNEAVGQAWNAGFISGPVLFNSTVTNYWGEVNENQSVPNGGIAVKGSSDAITVDLSDTSMVVVRFNLKSGEYQIARAAFQDFDEEAAGVPGTFRDITTAGNASTIQSAFTGFEQDGTRPFFLDTTNYVSDAFVTSESVVSINPWDVAAVASATNFHTTYFSVYRDAQSGYAGIISSPDKGHETVLGVYGVGRVVGDRMFDVPGSVSWLDSVLGLGNVTFDYSPTEAFDPQTGALWNTKNYTSSGYTVKAVVSDLTTGLAPGSVSVMAYSDGQGSFYELRLSQIEQSSDLQTVKNSLSIYRWVNGVPTLLVSKDNNNGTANNANANVAWTNTTSYRLEMEMNADGSINGKVFNVRTGTVIGLGAWEVSAPAGTATGAGTYGVYAYNCAPSVTVTCSGGSASAESGWSFLSDYWSLVSNEQAQRKVPPLGLVVEAIPRGDSDAAPSDYNATILARVDSVGAFGIRHMVIPAFLYANQFVRIKSTASGVALDNLYIEAYRGHTQNEQDGGWSAVSSWVTTNRVGASRCVMEFAMRRADPVYAATHIESISTNIYQWLISPLMTNGLGRIEFQARAASGHPLVHVQYAAVTLSEAVQLEDSRPEGFIDLNWQDVSGFPVVVSNSASFASYTAYVNLTTNDLEAAFGSGCRYGFFRVAHVMDGDLGATVEIDNVYAYGNPPGNANSWRAYNACFPDTVGSIDWARGLGFDGTPAGVLNNSLTKQVEDDSTRFKDAGVAPYLRSAGMEAGVGRLSFIARISTNGVYNVAASGGKVEFVVEAAPAALRDVPEEMWHPIHTLDGTAVTNTIDSQFYQQYTLNYYEPTNHVLRIRMLPGSDTGAFEDASGRPYRSRLLLENVLLEEPMRSGFVIDRVELNLASAGKTFDTLPKGETVPEQQPLLGHPITVDVKLGRRLLNPSDINVYFTWQRGTNDWGSWWNRLDVSSDAAATLPAHTTRLSPVAEGRTYQGTIGELGSLLYNTNNVSSNVVQYCVWATYKTTDGEKVFVAQDPVYTPFTEYPWYWPAPACLGTVHRAWSPYFWLYTSQPGNAWFNELNMVDFYNFTGVDMAQYVEIAAPEGLDLRNWKVRQVRSDYVPAAGEATGWTPPEGSIYTEVLIGSNLVGQPVNTVVTNNAQNGWAFFTLGNAPAAPLDQPLQANAFNSDGGSPYGLLLFRDNGAFEYGVTYCQEESSIEGMHEMAELSLQGGDYRQPLVEAGYDPEGSRSNVLAVVSGKGSNWVANVPPTPQNKNDEQELPEYENTTFAYVYSHIIGLGTQNNTTASSISEPVLPGYQPSPYTYRAAPLHEITSVTVDGIEYGADYGSLFTLQLPALTSTNDINIQVVFEPKALDNVITNLSAMLPSAPEVHFAIPDENMGVQAVLNTNGLAGADVNLFVSWHRSEDLTNFSDWGVTNWLMGIVTNDLGYVRDNLEALKTTEFDEGTESYSLIDAIPLDQFAAGDTIQYCVWAIVTDRSSGQSFTLVAAPGAFEQPQEYFPVDRNAEAEAKLGSPDFWSPYFIVHQCKPKKVWINEVNLVDAASTSTNLMQFVEICARRVEPMSLDGWKFEVSNAQGALMNLLLSGSTVKSDSRVSSVGFYLMKTSCATDGPVGQMVIPEIPLDQGALRLALYYPSGVLADAITVSVEPEQSLDGLTDWPISIVDAGLDSPLSVGSLGLANDESFERDWFDSDWTFSDSGWTPGAQNVNQRLDLVAPELYTIYLLPSEGGSMSFPDGSPVSESVYRWPEGTNAVVVYSASPGRTLSRIITKVGGETVTATDCAGATVWTNSFYVTSTMSVQAVYTEPEPVEANTVVLSVVVTSSDPTAYALSPRQPLIDDTPTVSVTVNPNAAIDQIYLSWYVGTNVWGVSSNGWLQTTLDASAALALPNTVPLVSAGSSTYFASNALPAIATPGEVVQYCVWGTYDGTKLFVQDAQRSFSAPSWYVPAESVELNRRFAGVSVEGVMNGFSAYYYVYGFPPGQVWFNEVNVWDPVDGGGGAMDHEHSGFVEVCMPATNFLNAANLLHLGNWSIVEYRAELVDGLVQLVETGSGRTSLTNRPVVASRDTGRGFFTLADALTTCTYDPTFGTNVFSQQLLSGTFDVNDKHLHVFKLFRENGAYEAGVAFFLRGADYEAGVEELEQLMALDPLIVDAGDDYNGLPGSLQMLGRAGTSSAYWTSTYASWSPQEVNNSTQMPVASQTIGSYPTVTELVDFLVSVAINIIDPRDPALSTVLVTDSATVTEGEGFSRTYELPKWYRLSQPANPAFTANAEQGTVTVSVNPVDSEQNLEASVVIESALGNLLTTAPGGVDEAAFEAWLAKYAVYDRGASLSTDGLLWKYWMDLNPTFPLTSTSLEISGYSGTTLQTLLLANGTPVQKLNPPAAVVIVTNTVLTSSGPWLPFVYGTREQPIDSGTTTINIPETGDESLFFKAALTNAPAGYYGE